MVRGGAADRRRRVRLRGLLRPPLDLEQAARPRRRCGAGARAPPARAARSRPRGRPRAPSSARARRRCAPSRPAPGLQLGGARHGLLQRLLALGELVLIGPEVSQQLGDLRLRPLQQVGGVEHPADGAGREDGREGVRVAVLVVLHELRGQDVAARLQVAAHQRDALLVEGDVGLHVGELGLRLVPALDGRLQLLTQLRDLLPCRLGLRPLGPDLSVRRGAQRGASRRRRGRGRRVAVSGSGGVGWTSCGSPRGSRRRRCLLRWRRWAWPRIRPACVRAARQPERPHAERQTPGRSVSVTHPFAIGRIMIATGSDTSSVPTATSNARRTIPAASAACGGSGLP